MVEGPDGSKFLSKTREDWHGIYNLFYSNQKIIEQKIYHGTGELFTPSGEKYHGKWVNGKRHSLFICTTSEGTKYWQQYENGELISSEETQEIWF